MWTYLAFLGQNDSIQSIFLTTCGASTNWLRLFMQIKALVTVTANKYTKYHFPALIYLKYYRH